MSTDLQGAIQQCGGIALWCHAPKEHVSDILRLPPELRPAALDLVPDGCREWVRQMVAALSGP